MKLSERLQNRLIDSGSKLKVDELSNTELIDLIAEDARCYSRSTSYPVLDDDFDTMKGE